MKTKLATAIAFSLLAGTTFAAPTFYGEVDVSIDYLPEDNANGNRDVVEVNSNNSFLGLKGDEKLTDRLSALYQAEFTLYTDDGQGGDGNDTFVPRNIFIGLKDTQLGTLKLGKIDTPVKQLSSVVDTFNNYIDNKADVAGIFTGENRIDNVVVYESPAFTVADGKLNANLLLATGEASGVAKSNGGAKVAGRGLGDAFSASLVYDNKKVIAGIGYDKAIPSNFAGRGFQNASEPEVTAGVAGSAFAAANTIRAIGRINLDNSLALKALYQTSEVDTVAGNDVAAASIDDQQAWLIGAEYNLPNAKNWTVKGQYSQSTTEFTTTKSDYEAQQILVGADYAFSKQVKAYGYAGYLTLEQGSNETKQPVLGTGFEYKF
ncbi:MULTISPECIES: porin [Acinetobacter]|uniref:porin n=1 Tax=Acinetobacter TaxID=469 RepID=UPI000263DF9A|nr:MULTISPECIES: porin [Acinetobacter]EIM39296.1 putative porin precursor [Acinetobacter sp. HA]MBB4834541.1 putative porin [Acinetobacter schindleri]WBX37349.1 porin [Acinetobacter schindleri]